jgi:hypothetical protein
LEFKHPNRNGHVGDFLGLFHPKKEGHCNSATHQPERCQKNEAYREKKYQIHTGILTRCDTSG